MLRNSSFSQSWPQPVDVLLYGTASPKSKRRNAETGCTVTPRTPGTPSRSPAHNGDNQENSSSGAVSVPRGRSPPRSASRTSSLMPSENLDERSSVCTVSRSTSPLPNDIRKETSLPEPVSGPTSPIERNGIEDVSSSSAVAPSKSPMPNDNKERLLPMSVSRATSPGPSHGIEEASASSAVSPAANKVPSEDEKEKSTLPSVPRATSLSPSNDTVEMSSSSVIPPSTSPMPKEGEEETPLSRSGSPMTSPGPRNGRSEASPSNADLPPATPIPDVDKKERPLPVSSDTSPDPSNDIAGISISNADLSPTSPSPSSDVAEASHSDADLPPTSPMANEDKKERRLPISGSRATSPRPNNDPEQASSSSVVSRPTSLTNKSSQVERSLSRPVSVTTKPKPKHSEDENSSTRSASPATSARPSDSNGETLCSVPSPSSLSPSQGLAPKDSNEEKIRRVPSPKPASPSNNPAASDCIGEPVLDQEMLQNISPLVSPSLDTLEQTLSYPGDELETPDSIRLLKIHMADDQTARIACTLRSVNLMESPRFRALSYTWGPASKAFSAEYEPVTSSDGDQQILCNDQVFFVPQNLADALLELRQSGFPEWLWVDAICINRRNAVERVGQVSIMGQIYKSAIETVAWLGKEESGIDDVQWGINVMIPRLLQRGPACWDSRPLKDPELRDIFGTENLSRRVIGIRTFLATRTWFHRAWVAQEVALAPSVCLLAGHRHFSWTDLTNLSIVLAKVPLDTKFLPRSRELNQGFSSAKTSLEKLQVLRDLIPRQVSGHASLPVPELHETYRFLETRYGTKTELELAAAWLAYLLSLVRPTESTERHDKIYSILGMAKLFSSEIDELVTPDYSRPIESVYTSVTTTLLLNSRYLSILAHVADVSDRKLLDLPSWVIDYSSTNPTNPILEFGKGQATHFDASLTSELPPFPRRIKGTKLTLIGAKFDHIGMVSPVTFDEVLGDPCHLEEFLKFVGNLPDRYLDGQSRTELLWRAMMMDSEETAQSINHPPASLFARRFQSWIIDRIGLWVADAVHKGMEVDAASESARQFFAQLYPDPKIQVPEEIQGDAEAFTLYHRKRMLAFVGSIEAKVSGRKLFLTGNKFVGMGPHSIQADDQIWLIRDSKTPLILRPKSGTQHFLLVGEAYLHGFMHGEMLDFRWDLEKRIGPVTIV